MLHTGHTSHRTHQFTCTSSQQQHTNSAWIQIVTFPGAHGAQIHTVTRRIQVAMGREVMIDLRVGGADTQLLGDACVERLGLGIVARRLRRDASE